IYTRYKPEGYAWSNWEIEAPGAAASDIAMATNNNGTLIQVIRGTDNNIYYRYTSNGYDYTPWWSISGGTNDAPSVAYFGGRFVIAIRGTDNRIYTSSNLNGTGWTGWINTEPTMFTDANVEMEVHGSHLFQSIRSTSGDKIYVRYSGDGHNWTGWANTHGGTADFVDLISFEGKLVMTIRGTDNRIYSKYSYSGTGNWSDWTYNVGATRSPVDSVGFNGNVYNSITGTDLNYSNFSRVSSDGIDWDGWDYNSL
ncbi:MAG TPA: hypothetical protein VGA67_03935, partial [Candidatus Dojkabacteria bacterium]